MSEEIFLTGILRELGFIVHKCMELLLSLTFLLGEDSSQRDSEIESRGDHTLLSLFSTVSVDSQVRLINNYNFILL